MMLGLQGALMVQRIVVAPASCTGKQANLSIREV